MDFKKIFKENNKLILINLLFGSINLYYERYPAIILFFLTTTYFFSNHPTIKKFREDKIRNDSRINSYYQNNLIVIYFFTRSTYLLAFYSFYFSVFPIFKDNISFICLIVIFGLVVDFITCFYIIQNNLESNSYWITFCFKAFVIIFIIYSTYATINPINELSYYYHMYGPSFFGAIGAAPSCEKHLELIDHIKTVYCYETPNVMHRFLDHNNSPNLNLIIYRIHSDPEEYLNWRSKLPLNIRPTYGLDKPIGEILNQELLDEMINCGHVSKTTLLSELKSNIQKVE